MNRKHVARALACRAWLPSFLAGLLIYAVPAIAVADDFDNDGDWDVDDIDALVGEVISGTNNPDFDLNDDGIVDLDDLTLWRLIGGIGNYYVEAYLVGDANLDGTVDATDLNAVVNNWQNSPDTWSGGDFNADGVVGAQDLDAQALNWQLSISQLIPGTLGWDPLYMDHGVVTVGGSAVQTLTLTNVAEDGTLVISNVQFTFNQQGAFSMSPFVSAYLDPGDSTAVELTFAPVDFSFFMADLRITSNATNAPVLIYNVLGMGDNVVCGEPYADCGGMCVLLDSDVNNCGSCGNVCTDPLNGSAFCGAGSCDFLCDTGYVKQGDGCVEPGPTPIGEVYTTVYQAAIKAIDFDQLTGKGPPSTDQDHPVVPHRLDTFVNMLDNAAVKGFDVGDFETACAMLNAMQVRSDGLAQPQDFVTGPAAPDLNAGIRLVIAEMDGCELREVHP